MSLKCTALLLKTQDTVPTLRVTHSQSSHQPTNYEIDQPTVERYDCVFLVSGWIRFLSTPMHTRRYLFGRHTLDFCFSPPHSTINSRHSEIKNKFHLNYKLEVRQSVARLPGSKYVRAERPPEKKTGTEITHTLTHDLQRLFAISFWSNDEKCLLNVKPNQIGDPKIYFTLHTARP